MSGRTVTIAGAAGAWGDSSRSTAQLLTDGRADYVIYEGLAEITMAILTRQVMEDPARGYARDLVQQVADNLAAFRAGGMRVVTNAGGVNPEAAADVIRGAAEQAGLEVRVATVTGESLRHRLDELRAAGVTEIDGGFDVPDDTLSLHAYLGARPIAAALDAGADVVVTGRVVDSALVLGPLIHEHGWGPDDLHLLSAGSLAGHLTECGAQATGGLMTDWQDTPAWVDPGYPLVEVEPDGTFVLTVARPSDGIADVRTAAEQLLYEIGDPTAYLLPDVVCDWSRVTLEQVGEDRVRVSGARGAPPPPNLKACGQRPDGWRVAMMLMIGGRDAAAKAERAGRDLLERGARMLTEAGAAPFRETLVEVLGAEATYGLNAATGARASREVLLRIAVHHGDRRAVGRFVREVPSLGLAGPPGVTAGGAGLPRPTPMVRLDSYLVPRELLVAQVAVDGEQVAVEDVDPATCAEPGPSSATAAPDRPMVDGRTVTLPLVALAHARSGDKGAHVNVGVRARHPDLLPWVRAACSAEAVGSWLAHLGATSVERFDLPGIDAVNLLLRDGLGAGGTASLRYDPQGKAVAQQVLDMPVQVPQALLGHEGLRAVPEVVVAREAVR